MKPFIKWSGGKSDEIDLFQKHIPKDYDLYIEPFIWNHNTLSSPMSILNSLIFTSPSNKVIPKKSTTLWRHTPTPKTFIIMSVTR